MRAKEVERSSYRRLAVNTLLSTVVALMLAAPDADAQSWATWAPDAQRSAATSTSLVLVVGTSEVIDHGAGLVRVSIGAPHIADVVVVSTTEVVVTGKIPGQTTLFLWDRAGGRTARQIYVTVDAPAVQAQLDRLLPGSGISATASGSTIILSGAVRDPGVEERVLALATSLAGDAQVLNQMTVPDRGQVMIKVRFAEVDRNALNEFGLEAFAVNGDTVAAGFGTGQFFRPSDGGNSLIDTAQDAVNFFLFHKPSEVQAFVRALESRGLLKSLAEPTLMAVPGTTASFLAGGEFPFPVLQGGSGGTGNAITVEFKEFGIRLSFTPTITNSGTIRLHTVPEVSQLDFSQGLAIGGFQVPALLTRRAETVIELASGQTFAIAGLVDNTMSKLVTKIPILGDIPILGALFRSEEIRQNRSELLVLVTPYIIRPIDGPGPPLPTGEPETWEGMEKVQEPGSETKRTQGEDSDGDDPEGADEGGVPGRVTLPKQFEPYDEAGRS